MDESYMNGYREAEDDYTKAISALEEKLRVTTDHSLQQEDMLVTLHLKLAIATKAIQKAKQNLEYGDEYKNAEAFVILEAALAEIKPDGMASKAP